MAKFEDVVKVDVRPREPQTQPGMPTTVSTKGPQRTAVWGGFR